MMRTIWNPNSKAIMAIEIL